MKAKIKTRLVASVFLIFALFMSVTPTLAASSYYDFQIYKSVNGKETGKFHSLTANKTASISGKAWYNHSKDKSGGQVNIAGETVKYCLKRDRFGFDKDYGCVDGYVSFKTTNYNNGNNFSGTFKDVPDEKSDKYYLVITKGNGLVYVQGEGNVKQ
nr:hypothetical protein [Paenibacillus bovis]